MLINTTEVWPGVTVKLTGAVDRNQCTGCVAFSGAVGSELKCSGATGSEPKLSGATGSCPKYQNTINSSSRRLLVRFVQPSCLSPTERRRFTDGALSSAAAARRLPPIELQWCALCTNIELQWCATRVHHNCFH